MTPDEPQHHYELDRMAEDAWRMFRILGEFSIGFDRMAHVRPPLVTVFGSARTEITDRYYSLEAGQKAIQVEPEKSVASRMRDGPARLPE